MARGPRTLVLLRGINVGGKHLMPMARLREVFIDELACADVETYLQSGNLVCTAPPEQLDGAIVAKLLEERFGFPVPVVLRTAAEFAAGYKANPFNGSSFGIDSVHWVFLRAPLSDAKLAPLKSRAMGKEQLATHGKELFLYLPHGFGRSKLALAVTADKAAGATVRNWKTVNTLRGMLAG